MQTFNIPVGISDFSEIRQNGYYYVDKTGLIAELLNSSAAKVTLITRPRRFGKTLGMSMLAAFFDIHKNSDTLFEGLEISKDTASCQKWMNQYPTLFLTFKDGWAEFLMTHTVSLLPRLLIYTKNMHICLIVRL